MSRRQKEPLRALSDEERKALSQLSRSGRSPSGRVARATALLAVAEGQSYTAAAKQVGRRNGDTVALWVARFNREGLAAVVPRHGGGPPVRCAAQQQRRILAEAERIPDRARDGAATWSLSTLRHALRKAQDGLHGRVGARPSAGYHAVRKVMHSRRRAADAAVLGLRRPDGNNG